MRKKGGKTKNHKSKKRRRMKRERLQERESSFDTTQRSSYEAKHLPPSLSQNLSPHSKKRKKEQKEKYEKNKEYIVVHNILGNGMGVVC